MLKKDLAIGYDLQYLHHITLQHSTKNRGIEDSNFVNNYSYEGKFGP